MSTIAPDRRADCPQWCTVAHGPSPESEDDRLHASDPVVLAGAVVGRVCCSVDGEGHIVDGPYVLVGLQEFTLDEARTLGERLLALVGQVTPLEAS